MAKPAVPPPGPAPDTNELIRRRHAKMEALRARGLDPFGARLKEAGEDELKSFGQVRLAGRVVSFRDHGKTCFAHLRDRTGAIQLYARADGLGDRFPLFRDLDVGDFVGVTGELMRTRTGELTVQVKEMEFLAKALRPLPEKWHGLKDVETRYRRRYVDLVVNPHVRETFVLKSRLIQTLLDLLQVIVMHRHRQHGLVLSELGSYLLGPVQAPAGTKRIDRLLKSPRWQAATLIDYLWEKGDEAVQRLMHPQDDIYAIWDESVVEKPESLQAERLGPVRSSKARRLLRIKPGYYTPPRGPSALVDDPRRGSQRQTDRRSPGTRTRRPPLGTAGGAHLGSGLCRRAVGQPGGPAAGALHSALEEKLPVGDGHGPTPQGLGMHAWQALPGPPLDP